MADKNMRLYRVETVEVVEEGTKEEPGFFYEYLGAVSGAVAGATAATPRTSARAQRQAEAGGKRAASRKAGAPPAAPGAGTEKSPNGRAPLELPDEPPPDEPPVLADDAQTLKLDAKEIGENDKADAEEPVAGSEEELLSDAAIEGVEVVETEEAYEHNSEMVPTVEPGLRDAESLSVVDEEAAEEGQGSEELVPVLAEADAEDEWAQEEDSAYAEEEVQEASALLDEPPRPLDVNEEDDGFDGAEHDDDEALAAFGEDENLPEVIDDEGDGIEEPFADEQDLDEPGAEPNPLDEESDDLDEEVPDFTAAGMATEVMEEAAEADIDSADLEEIPELPDDVMPLDEPAESGEGSKETNGDVGNVPGDEQAPQASPAKINMQEGSNGGSKRATTRLENTRARTNKLGSTTRTKRSDASEGERSSRPVPVQRGISAKAHKRITIASYSIVAMVVLIIGGYYALTHFGVIEESSDDNGRARGESALTGNGGDERTEEERSRDRHIQEANRAYSSLERQFASAERAREIRDEEDFRTAAISYLRFYWLVKYHLAQASFLNLQIGGERIDTGMMPMLESLTDAERERIARQTQALGRKMRRMERWITDMDMSDIREHERVVTVQERYDGVEEEIEQWRIDEGDVEALVDQRIEAWLEADGEVGSAVHRINSDEEIENVVEKATDTIRKGLVAMTRYYEAVILDPDQHTGAWQNQTQNRYRDLEKLSEIDGVPPLEQFDEFEAFRRARNEALY